MKAQEHPEYREEKKHLNDTIESINGELKRLKVLSPIGGDRYGTRGIRSAFGERVYDLEDALKQPYFGRVDWVTDGGESKETFYIGKYLVDRVNVYSWQDTLVADLWFGGDTPREGGRLLLRRAYEIKQGQIRTIRDEYVDAELADRLQMASFTDSLLLALLRESRTEQLHEIVATIQKQQYQIIKLPKDQPVVIQGAPGSGKTSIALHRVAYLLYHHRNEQTFSPNRILVLGPNRIFLEYVSGVLPSLGERQIPQKTFDEWLLSAFENPITHESQETALEFLLSTAIPTPLKAMHYRNAVNKSSVKMVELVDHYLSLLEEEVSTYETPLRVNVTVPRVTPEIETVTRITAEAERSPQIVKEVFNGLRKVALNNRRAELEQVLLRDVSRELTNSIARNAFERDELQSPIRASAQQQIHDYFQNWNSLNVIEVYRRLMRTPRLLSELDKGLFNQWDLELMTMDVPSPSLLARYCDLPILLYLSIRLNGTKDITFDHIVVDEAQDVSPLFFKLLHSFSRDGSMTVLGDIAQGIYTFCGVDSWETLLASVQPKQWAKESIRQGYRSTQQIAEYANAMLRRLGTDESLLTEPIARPGPEPSLHQCEDRATLGPRLVEILREEQQVSRRSIAVICKTLDACRQISEALASIKGLQLIADRDARYQGGLAVMPSYLSKGLEFDCVVVADADNQTYVPDELNARLLYVAITRAAHSLHVCWAGTLTPLLDPNVTRVELQPMFAGRLEPDPVTIASFAQDYGLDSDWCVERLARADKLRLLRDGKIDRTLLEVFFDSLANKGNAHHREDSSDPRDENVEDDI